MQKFIDAIVSGYTSKGDCIHLGAGIFEGKAWADAAVKIPLRTMNRHGLISGATGTGKTKTIQAIAEELSSRGIPVLLMDIKGDMSGLAAPGTESVSISERMNRIGVKWSSQKFPVEFFSLSDEKGVRLRATVSEFGPVLFSKILELNDIQSGVVSLVFKYADDRKLPLLDLKDFKKTLQYLTNEGKDEIKNEYGAISTASTSTIIRKIIEIEQQGADIFFGEKSFDTDDLLRVDENGFGILNIIRLTDIQDRPKLFSTFMLGLLAEIYATFPEEGDHDQPKLVIFIDEAHLIFKEASKVLLSQLETIIKLIRSKGVGVYFCTQIPSDVPKEILSQLGLKVQHAMRAFTADDRKNIKQVAANYPLSDFYKTEDLLTSLGIGEALITSLNEKGIPSPLVHTLLCAPRSRMGILEPQELDTHTRESRLAAKYNETIDRESAYEMLSQKMNSEAAEKNLQKEKQQPTAIEQALDSTAGRQVIRTVTSVLTRGLLGALGITGSTRRKRSGWF